MKCLHVWNKAALTKLHLALAYRKDKLWVEWIHICLFHYAYIKQKGCLHYAYSMLHGLRGKFRDVETTLVRLVCGMQITVEMASQSNLCNRSFKDHMRRWCGEGWSVILKLVLILYSLYGWLFCIYYPLKTESLVGALNVCKAAVIWSGSREHWTLVLLLLSLSSSAEVWKYVLNVLQVRRQMKSFREEVHIAIKIAKKTSATSKFYLMAIAEVIYSIWVWRNAITIYRVKMTPTQRYKEVICGV